MFFRTPPEHVTLFYNHHIIAVFCDGTLLLPGTPPGTNSCHPPGTSASTHTDENAIIHGDEPNCPAPADGIGPMSERTNDTTDPLQTTILAQTRTQTKSAFCPATKNYPATDIRKIKLPVFQSHINFQTARPQLLPAATHLNSSQFLRRFINYVPPSSTATTKKYPPPSATLHTSTKTWTL
jgi:hypothetical protein